MSARRSARPAVRSETAPDPVQHIIFRSSRHPDGIETEGYFVPGLTRRLDQAGLDTWLSLRPASSGHHTVSVLVIREVLDLGGLILQCTIERRLGSIRGPLYGDPARVEFTGAASAVRLYNVCPNGVLIETVPSADPVVVPQLRAPEYFAGEQLALQARFGDDVRILDAREPTLFEDLVGLSSVLHVHVPDRPVIGCGVGWHGQMPFVLEAEFPRFAATLELSDAEMAAVDAAIRTHGLVRGEMRVDEAGLAILARRRSGEELFLLRLEAGQIQMEPHVAGRAAAGPDQRRWMQYIETYEDLMPLDAWCDGGSDDLIVLTGDPDGQLWRHDIDADGVETWRRSERDAALGALHRERLFPGSLMMEDAGSDDDAVAAGDDPRRSPDSSLLIVGDAYVKAREALRRLRVAPAGDTSQRDILHTALTTLQAHRAAGAVQELPSGHDAAGLDRIEGLLAAELTQTQCIIVTLSPRSQTTVGPDVAERFPSVQFDFDEAWLCLALGRATASVYHSMRIVEQGIGLLAQWIGVGDPLAGGDREWQMLTRTLHGAVDLDCADALAALDDVQRSWGSSQLRITSRYTAPEAESIFGAVGDFLQALVGLQPHSNREDNPI